MKTKFKDIPIVVTNYNGEVIEWTGTRYEALNKGYNVDCTGCTNCVGCTDCTGCVGCTRCTDCTNCIRCTRCTNCIRCTNCTNCVGCTQQPVAVITTKPWTICIRQDGTLKIGCQDHPLVQWLAFTDEQINKMSEYTPAFWKVWKPVVEQLHKIHFKRNLEN